jgi:hypothetical protein
MYCPKCSQKQISEDFRFCSRCGFQMEGVMQLLANDGVFPMGEKSDTSLFRRAVSTLGGKIIISSFVLFVFAFIFAVADGVPEVLLLPFLLFLIGLVHIAYVFIFSNKTSAINKPETAKQFNPADTRKNLPPIQSVPVAGYESPRRDDGELIPPPSVTEPTTKLFKSEGDTNDL